MQICKCSLSIGKINYFRKVKGNVQQKVEKVADTNNVAMRKLLDNIKHDEYRIKTRRIKSNIKINK